MFIHHLAIRTNNLEQISYFYQHILGLKPVRHQEDYSVWLSTGSSVIMIEQEHKEMPKNNHHSNDLIAFGVNQQQKEAMEQQLIKHEIRIDKATNFTTYFRDPEGRKLGISTYPCSEFSMESQAEPLFTQRFRAIKQSV